MVQVKILNQTFQHIARFNFHLENLQARSLKELLCIGVIDLAKLKYWIMILIVDRDIV